mgnify:CR=1 FL=1
MEYVLALALIFTVRRYEQDKTIRLDKQLKAVEMAFK